MDIPEETTLVAKQTISNIKDGHFALMEHTTPAIISKNKHAQMTFSSLCLNRTEHIFDLYPIKYKDWLANPYLNF